MLKHVVFLVLLHVIVNGEVCDGDFYSNVSTICTNITGSLTLESTDLTNLDSFVNLTYVGGDFNIWSNLLLTNIDGLSNLNFVGRSLSFRNSPLVLNLDGFSNVMHVQNNLEIWYFHNMTNVDGLNGITETNTLWLAGLNTITNVDGLSSVTRARGHININSCQLLQNIYGLLQVETIGGNLILEQLPSLTNLNGLASLRSIGTYISIKNNDVLEDFYGLVNVSFFEGYIEPELGCSIEFNDYWISAAGNGLNCSYYFNQSDLVGTTTTVIPQETNFITDSASSISDTTEIDQETTNEDLSNTDLIVSAGELSVSSDTVNYQHVVVNGSRINLSFAVINANSLSITNSIVELQSSTLNIETTLKISNSSITVSLTEEERLEIIQNDKIIIRAGSIVGEFTNHKILVDEVEDPELSLEYTDTTIIIHHTPTTLNVSPPGPSVLVWLIPCIIGAVVVVVVIMAFFFAKPLICNSELV